MSFNDRTLTVVGESDYEKITNRHIVLVGVGGVGGAVLECLVRFGVKKITIIDFDTVDESNLNRQLISTVDAVGKIKVEVAKRRALSIRPDCDIDAVNMFIRAENLDFIGNLQPDYVRDCIDSVKSKLDLVRYCHEKNIPIISAMGTGGRFSPYGFVIGKIEDTAGNGCGLSRVMRRELKKRGVVNHTCLYNINPPETKQTHESHGRHAPGSTVFAPNIAGIMIAHYVCEQLKK